MTVKYGWTRFWAPEGVTVNDYGFLPDPRGLFGNDKLVTFDQIENIPCLILVGNPGIGKSYAIREAADMFRAKGLHTVFKDFREFSDFSSFVADIEQDTEYLAWQAESTTSALHLFLDSLDEGLLEIKRLDHGIKRFLENLPLDRVRLRITCRSSDLPRSFVDSMRASWSEKPDQPMVSVYSLTQLRRQDVILAASDLGIADPTAFINVVENTAIEPFAALPVTLVNMLFPIYMDYGQLPDSRREIYSHGCRVLARETSISRQEDGHEGDYTSEERTDAARLLATLSIIGNRPRISTGVIPEPGVLNTQECQTVDYRDQHPQDERLLRETLKTALFASTGEYHIWAHRSYGEFLAAEFLTNIRMPLVQVQSLFVNPFDSQQRTTPKLHETVAWLASMRPDVFDWLFRTEPIVLLKSDSVHLTTGQRAALVNRFVSLYAEDGIMEDRVAWNDFKRLSHPDIGEQLRLYLGDKLVPLRARHFCMECVVITSIVTIDDVLLKIALDPTDDAELRKDALHALRRPARDTASLTALRILISEPSEYQADNDLTSLAVDILWFAGLLATSELFSYLRMPGLNDFVIGSPYDQLFRPEIVNQIPLGDLPIALHWVAEHTREKSRPTEFSGEEFTATIMRRAWSHLDNEDIRAGFARAAWAHLTHYVPILPYPTLYAEELGKTGTDYARELRQNSAFRRTSLEAMLSVLSAQGLRNDELLSHLRYGSDNTPFILEEDKLWLLEKACTDPSLDHRHAYAYFLDGFFSPLDTDLIEQVYFECMSGYRVELEERFGKRFEAVDLDSAEAQVDRQVWSERRESAKRRADREEALKGKEIQLRDLILETLRSCEVNSAEWWHLSQYLIANEYGSYFNGTWDIREGHGWQLIKDDSTLVEKILMVAVQYIEEQHPFIGDYELATAIYHHPPALEGYRALLLIAAIPSLLADLQPHIWKKWSASIIFNPYPKPQHIADRDALLLENAWKHGAAEALEYLNKQLDISSDKHILQEVLQRAKYTPKQLLAEFLLNYIGKDGSAIQDLDTVLNYFLSFDPTSAENVQVVLMKLLRKSPSTDEDRTVNQRVITSLMYYARDNTWWEIIWELVASDYVFAKAVLDITARRDFSPYFRLLTIPQLYELYLLAVKLYPFSEDIVFHGGLVPPRYTQQEWRDSILRVIATRGTLESVEVITKMYTAMPTIPSIAYLLEQAKSSFRMESWIAPAPADILNLIRQHNTRLLRNAEQLQELVLVTLSEIQEAFRASPVLKNSIWAIQPTGSFRPVNEETFSDTLAEQLRERIGRVIVNREVQLRFTSQSHDRNDIQIEALSDTGIPLMVIVEVKACWYQNLYEPMQTQLVDQYIANHDRCNHGIYLVGYFSCPHWDVSDGAHIRKCAERSLDIISSNLNTQLKSLTSPKPVTVKTFIFDASRP